MAKTITISLSDELYVRLQTVKQNLNVSKICQQVLIEAVMLEETKGSQDLEILKKRIQKEREQLVKPYYDEGFKDGTKEAYSYSYKEFQRYLSHLDLDDPGVFFEYGDSDIINKKVYAIQDGELLLGEINDHYGEPNKHDLIWAEGAYCKGWEDGVGHIWDQVKESCF